jgi:hypothetical protein
MLSLLFFLTTARRRADAGALEGRHGAMNPTGRARGGDNMMYKNRSGGRYFITGNVIVAMCRDGHFVRSGDRIAVRADPKLTERGDNQ